jgi:hypothetical protein
VGTSLELVVSVHCRDGKEHLLSAPLAGTEEEGAARQLAPSDLESFPPTLVPVVFVSPPTGAGFAGQGAGFWDSLRVSSDPAENGDTAPTHDQLAHAALVSIVPGQGVWRLWVSVPHAEGRRFDEKGLPVVDPEDDLPIELPTPGASSSRHEVPNVAGGFAFIGILPFTLAIDAAIAAIVVGAPIAAGAWPALLHEHHRH